MDLADKKEILNGKTELGNYDEVARGIYFLIKGDKVVYVGKSETNIFDRVTNHSRSKDFDSFYYKLYPKANEEELHLIEARYIAKYAPKYNGQIQSPDYEFVTGIKKFGYETDNKQIHLNAFIINNKIYIDKEHLRKAINK